jgi:DnaJ homolog subfamily C member 3
MIGRSLATLAVGAALLSSPLVRASDAIPSDLPVAQLLTAANAHLTAGRLQEALSYFDAAISRDPQNYLTLFKRGTAYMSLGRSDQAERDFDAVLKLKPGFEGALIPRAKIKSRNGRWHEAREDYTAAGKGDGEEVAELAEAEGAAKLAEEAEAAKSWDDCIAQAGVALRIAPALLPLRNARYRCRLEKGDVESAVSDMQHIMQLSGSTDPHLHISALSFYSLGETDKGLASIRKCLQSDPDNKPCRKLMKREKPIDKRIKQLNVLWEKGSFTTSAKLLIKTSEDQGLIQDVLDDFEELKKEGIIHEKAPNGLHAQMIERACQAYIEVGRARIYRRC